MTSLGVTEILLIAGMVALPCLGILVVGGVVAVVIALARKIRD